jgi:uroporphyrinogen decarboxylase
MAEMTSRERVLTTIQHIEPDRVPLYANSIDPKFIMEVGCGNFLKTCEYFNLDVLPYRLKIWCQGLPGAAALNRDIPIEEQTGGGLFAGWNGIDEFGRVWKRGSYVGGDLKHWPDIEKYIPPLRLEERAPSEEFQYWKEQYPDKAYCLSAHLGPFGLTIESIGFQDFFYLMFDDLELVKEIIKKRTSWFIEVCRYSEQLGVDFIVMGDDAGFKGKTFISPNDFEKLVIPNYKLIADSVRIPIFWHSDGFIEPLIPLAIEAGIKGLHAIEPQAGNDLGRIKALYGDKLVLLGNVDSAEILIQTNLDLVRNDVERCMAQAKKGGGYMLATSNSVHSMCTLEALREMYRYALEIGKY